MNPFSFLSALTPMVKPLFDLIPNSNDRKKAEEDFNLKVLEAVNEQTKGVNETNKIEAASSSVFVAGWRPYIGWVCGTGIAYGFIFRDLIAWGIRLYNPAIEPPPTLELGQLLGLLSGMLGLGGLRTLEKVKGVDRSNLREP